MLSKPRKRKKGASGGVAILIRETIANNFQVLDTENDNACTIWIKMKGHPNCPIILGLLYNPPEGSPYADPSIFDTIERDIIDLSSQQETCICLVGDFNARNGELDDYIHTADNCFISNDNPLLYDDAPHVLEKHGLLKKRCSKDHYASKFGHKLLQMCKSLGLLIMNGRCNGDKGICKFTCKNTSVVDFCISSKNMIRYIE